MAIKLNILDVAYRGAGVARHDGLVVFVPHTLPGETVLAEIRLRKARFAEADLVEVLDAAPARVAPACPLARACPGCCYQHVRYPDEVALKQAQLLDVLRKIGRLAMAPALPPQSAPEPLGYRNKVVLHAAHQAGGPVLGYVAADNATVVDVPQCPLAQAPINTALAAVRLQDYQAQALQRATLTLRCTQTDGAVTSWGRPERDHWLTETTPWGPMRVPAAGFWQVNPPVATLLAAQVLEKIETLQPQAVMDLYCGAGLFALLAGRAGVRHVRGVDTAAAAIDAAFQNAQAWNLPALQFIAAPAERGLAGFPGAPEQTLVILDPPRRGLERPVVAALERMAPRDLLCISCAPDTLARDLALLAAAGFGVQSLQLLDMFPRTYGFETLAWLQHVP